MSKKFSFYSFILLLYSVAYLFNQKILIIIQYHSKFTFQHFITSSKWRGNFFSKYCFFLFYWLIIKTVFNKKFERFTACMLFNTKGKGWYKTISVSHQKEISRVWYYEFFWAQINKQIISHILHPQIRLSCCFWVWSC